MTLGGAAVGLLLGWMAVLTLVVLLLVRQLGLVTARLTSSTQMNLADHGPPLQASIAMEATILVPSLTGPSRYLVTLSGSCLPCRALVSEMEDQDLFFPLTILLAGSAATADEVADLIPSGAEVIRDPIATEVTSLLGIQMTPFGVALQNSRVIGKRYISAFKDLESLVQEAEGGVATAPDERLAGAART